MGDSREDMANAPPTRPQSREAWGEGESSAYAVAPAPAASGSRPTSPTESQAADDFSDRRPMSPPGELLHFAGHLPGNLPAHLSPVVHSAGHLP